MKAGSTDAIERLGMDHHSCDRLTPLGWTKASGFGKSLAQSLRIFKSEIKSDDKTAKDEPKKDAGSSSN